MVIMGNTDWIGMSSHVTRNDNLISFNLGGKGTDVKWGGGVRRACFPTAIIIPSIYFF